MNIYFPMTAEILTVGHIKCLEYLSKRGTVFIGLLTPTALKGYKKCAVPLRDREYILRTVANGIGNILITFQNSIDPSDNIKILGCNAIASGDGWEIEEEIAIECLGLKKIDIPFPKKYSSSDIKTKISEQNDVV